MTAVTLTKLGMIEFESRSTYSEEDSQTELISFQPHRTRLDNDGCYTYWITVGATWTLEHDGVGWRARMRDEHPYMATHVHRLADADGPKGSFVTSLPLEGGGRIELVPGAIYELRMGTHAEGNKGALWLSEIS